MGMKQTTIRFEEETLAEIDDIAESRSELIRELANAYVETADIDEAVARTRRSFARARLAQLKSEIEVLESQKEDLEELFEDADEDGEKVLFKVDLSDI